MQVLFLYKFKIFSIKEKRDKIINKKRINVFLNYINKIDAFVKI